MTTSTAVVLPRRDPGPVSVLNPLCSLPVLGGYAADGQSAAALFLWAHTRFSDDFDFGLHHHEGLEILTVILEGAMRHYDIETGRWADLNPADAQMMQSGTGISHIERAAGGGRGFQIQFDPGYTGPARREPSCADYPATMFARHPVDAAAVTEIIGHGGPVEARTEGLTVRRAALPADSHAELPVGTGRVTLAYLIDGAATTNGAHAVADDVVSLHGMDDLTVGAAAATDLLVVSVPASPSYEPRHVDPREMSRPGMAAGAR